MDLVGGWNSLTYVDGLLFSLWIGVLYFLKGAIDDYWWRRK